MFVILIQYQLPDLQVNEHKEGHKFFLEQQVKEGNFITAGTRSPETGEVILSCLEDIETLHNVLYDDPYYKKRIGKYEIIEFTPHISCAHLENYIREQT